MTERDERTALYAPHGFDVPPSAEHDTDLEVGALVEELKRPASPRLVEEQLLASGGMGTVSVVVDRALGRRMAKKSIQPMLRDDARIGECKIFSDDAAPAVGTKFDGRHGGKGKVYAKGYIRQTAGLDALSSP